MPPASKKKREPSTVLKPRTKAMADALLDGKAIKDVAQSLGITTQSVNQTKLSTAVRSYMGNSQKELQDVLQIKRGDIVIAMLEAAEDAKLAADHGTMVRAYTEVAKMLGLYAPEVKQINITTNQRAMMSKYESMTDAELLQLSESGHISVTIDGESETIQ